MASKLARHFFVVFSFLSVMFVFTAFRDSQTMLIPFVFLLIVVCTISVNLFFAVSALRKGFFQHENKVFSLLSLLQVAYTLVLYAVFVGLGLA
ncbi:hypothetical protein [Listeria monocytogenes]|uniref:hypothetical protein n=1 Tax=Listeria monocytogenes TaxID=1639 RepID=UPI0011EAC56C|nr:hypothetical protein [Listeria monocytogenes]EAF4531702.1 hypothetical protein [Listeria monocytogenes serotype 1/2a]EHD1581077.1 hypothetical protein [Listeria monocytogenes]EJU4174070.1 hypothetical protein [Listeria monocytogenes]EJU4182012.1 hypothetical protein [Listeria monocytogenes]EKZ0245328.1 hypothetical protein [Listeria monocytogenes]